MSKQPVKLNATGKFKVLDLPSVNQTSSSNARDKQRATKESGSRIVEQGNLIGNPNFSISPNPAFLTEREEIFKKYWDQHQQKLALLPDEAIEIVLPDGTVKTGVAHKTSPLDIATSISKGLAESAVIAKVKYSTRVELDEIIACDKDDEDAATSEETNASEGELWDMNRPLIGNCQLQLLKFDDPQAKTVFWHSSAHVLGAAMESLFGCQLTIGPALQSGFYYDCFMGSETISEDALKNLDNKASEFCKKKYPFERLVLSKDQALEMFASNPFKVNLIRAKIPDGAKTTVYKCGHLVDLCMGPHLPNTGRIKAFASVKTSSTNWLGQVKNDPLQRVYGVAFPDKDLLKKYKEFQELAKLRDHRTLGTKQELFFFHQLSPGSAFWMPHGGRVYNRLIQFIRKEYWDRGYEEVVTPNMFNMQLWETSGHAQHYKKDMFVFDVEGHEFALKPMNCPGHCLMFAHRLRSYRELPLRLADFGVLHRNEISGALTGLTRVRRFQQDDAHIFCRSDQIKHEINGVLNFMRHVYTIFGMTYELNLSTRPDKALGDIEVWNNAEKQLAEALDEFAGVGGWKVKPKDGAFYGPKIDIQITDALERHHQCATIQLDFQLPIRFDLQYKTATEGEDAFAKPVMIHRAILGSVERMAGVLTEHFGGKWPLWLSPRQLVVVPVDLKYLDYGYMVQQEFHRAGYYIDIDDSTRTLNKKVREAQLSQYNFILVVGQAEAEENTVNIRNRDNQVEGVLPIGEAIAKFNQLLASHQ